MQTKEIYLKRIFSTFIIFTLILTFIINENYNTPERYGDDIFLIQGNVLSPILTIGIFSFLLFQYSKIIEKIILFRNNYIKLSGFWIIFLISLFYKYCIFQFNFYGTYTETIENIFIKNEFNDYKLYNYIAYLFYKISPNHNTYLFLLNNILGSLSLSFFYLILKNTNKIISLNHIVIILVMMYMPFIALETMLRVDMLYIFLLVLSVYIMISMTEEVKNKNIILFLLIMLIMTLTREQTLYFLPLYLFYILIKDLKKKIYISFLLVITVVISSLLISNFNKHEYGISSKYRDFHLIVKILQYGYLNENIIKGYENKLSDDAKELLYEINSIYKANILPHKRETASSPESPYYYLFRPDNETIRQKSMITNGNVNMDKIRILLLDELSKIKNKQDSINLQNFDQKISLLTNKLEKQNEKEMLLFTKSLIINQYLTKENIALGHILLCKNNNTEKYKINCLIGLIKSVVNKDYIKNRSDNWFYTKTAFQFALIPNLENTGYVQHKKIDKINEIILSLPTLYFVQSILTATSITGRVPIPVNIGESKNFYTNNIIPTMFIEKPFQKLYRTPINFWYIFSLWGLVLSIMFNKNIKTRNNNIFMSLVPLYYGFFLSFATYAEFMRLMIPIIPFIIYNFMVIVKFIFESYLPQKIIKS
ncbi:MAG: hypothetical protein CMD65_00655 [Gammaproteobacteria bacterium]|nr:hypothetical protein [Gammaproteobacteria bacterium]|tara:strand:- start:3851 stop:5809 length:1959 start_codon:yes stop_codon:yes gene_type:complete